MSQVGHYVHSSRTCSALDHRAVERHRAASEAPGANARDIPSCRDSALWHLIRSTRIGQ